jgi:hypothetical protein
MTFTHSIQNPISKFPNYWCTPNNYQFVITCVVNLVI